MKYEQAKDPIFGGWFSVVYTQITPKGRKLVREATSEQHEKSLPVGTLREWHWKAMVEAWKAKPQSVKDENGYYGHLGWKTWLRLRDYKAGSLMEEYHTARRYLAHVGHTEQIYWIRLTPYGEQYYRENWQRYRELYPKVNVPAPE